MTRITYAIEVPQENVEQIQILLQQHNIPFDPRRNIMASNDAFRADSTLFGNEAKEALESINAYLEEKEIPERARTDHEEWSPTRLQEFLQFAVDNFNWADGKVEYAWWDASDEEWTGIVSQHAWLFQQD